MDFDLENPLPTSKEDILFHIETHHMPSPNYLQALLSSSSTLSLRRQIVSSIFHLSTDFDPFLPYLAINYTDRFLSTHSIPEGKPWILKLVAVSCVSLALKMRNTPDFSVANLLSESGFVAYPVAIQRMEMLILGALKWRMRSVSPFSFVNYFLSFLKASSIQTLKSRATEVILKAQNDIKLLDFKPSTVSAAALLLAVDEVFPAQVQSFRDALCGCSRLEKEKLMDCYELIQEWEIEERVRRSCTPANVLDLHCFSSSVSICSGNSDECEGEKCT